MHLRIVLGSMTSVSTGLVLTYMKKHSVYAQESFPFDVNNTKRDLKGSFEPSKPSRSLILSPSINHVNDNGPIQPTSIPSNQKPESQEEDPKETIETNKPFSQILLNSAAISFGQTLSCSPIDVLKTKSQTGKTPQTLKTITSTFKNNPPRILFAGAGVNGGLKTFSYAGQLTFIPDPDISTINGIFMASLSSALCLQFVEFSKTIQQKAKLDDPTNNNIKFKDVLHQRIAQDRFAPIRGFYATFIRELIFISCLWDGPKRIEKLLEDNVNITGSYSKLALSSIITSVPTALLTVVPDTVKTMAHVGESPKQYIQDNGYKCFMKKNVRALTFRSLYMLVAFPVIRLIREGLENYENNINPNKLMA